MVLAGFGLYGVLSRNVAERTQEIGGRAAPGAFRTELPALVMRQGLKLTGIGVSIGIVVFLRHPHFAHG